jgi:hypothetical protein
MQDLTTSQQRYVHGESPQNPQEIRRFFVLYPTAKEYAQIIYALSMKFFSLIINELRKTLINIEKIFDLPIAFELVMNLLYDIKQRQMVGSSLT